jgi:hypothetical protein
LRGHERKRARARWNRGHRVDERKDGPVREASATLKLTSAVIAGPGLLKFM